MRPGAGCRRIRCERHPAQCPGLRRQKPTQSRTTPPGSRRCAGSVRAMVQSASHDGRFAPRCSQLRRRPSAAVSKDGIGKRSTKGAHAHLKPKAIPTQLMWPMVLRSTPASRNQKLRVPNTSKKGSPAEKPSASIRKRGRFCIDLEHVPPVGFVGGSAGCRALRNSSGNNTCPLWSQTLPC